MSGNTEFADGTVTRIEVTSAADERRLPERSETALVASVRRAQALQNPFPPSEYPDADDPLDVDVDNVTFAVGWYIGGVLGLTAGAYVSAGVGTYAPAAS